VAEDQTWDMYCDVTQVDDMRAAAARPAAAGHTQEDEDSLDEELCELRHRFHAATAELQSLHHEERLLTQQMAMADRASKKLVQITTVAKPLRENLLSARDQAEELSTSVETIRNGLHRLRPQPQNRHK